MHFSPFNQGRIDPTVIEMLRNHLEQKPEQIDKNVTSRSTEESVDVRKAAWYQTFENKKLLTIVWQAFIKTIHYRHAAEHSRSSPSRLFYPLLQDGKNTLAHSLDWARLLFPSTRRLSPIDNQHELRKNPCLTWPQHCLARDSALVQMSQLARVGFSLGFAGQILICAKPNPGIHKFRIFPLRNGFFSSCWIWPSTLTVSCQQTRDSQTPRRSLLFWYTVCRIFRSSSKRWMGHWQRMRVMDLLFSSATPMAMTKLSIQKYVGCKIRGSTSATTRVSVVRHDGVMRLLIISPSAVCRPLCIWKFYVVWSLSRGARLRARSEPHNFIDPYREDGVAWRYAHGYQ